MPPKRDRDPEPKSVLARNLDRLIPPNRRRWAERHGFKPGRIYAWIRGEKPEPPDVAALAHALNVSTDDLLEEPEAPQPRGLPAGAIPIPGRVAAGRLADEGAGGWRAGPQKAMLEIAGLRVTIIVEPAV